MDFLIDEVSTNAETSAVIVKYFWRKIESYFGCGANCY